MWFRFSRDEPLRRNTHFGKRGVCISGQQVNHDPESRVPFLALEIKHRPGGKLLARGGLRKTWGLVLALPLTCFRTLNKSFERPGLQPFPEVKGSDPIIKKFPLSSGILDYYVVYPTVRDDTGGLLLEVTP